jgi:transcription initiation factor TFIIIB Brf1 subunit/transcription initiation factor TFIIB
MILRAYRRTLRHDLIIVTPEYYKNIDYIKKFVTKLLVNNLFNDRKND